MVGVFKGNSDLFSAVSGKLCGCGPLPLEFQLPTELEASEPPEARGLTRDQVRLMVSHYGSNRIVHTRFRDVVRFLDAGDVVVVNTSGTMNAAVTAIRGDGTALELHLSTRLPADLWSVELRRPVGNATEPFHEGQAGEVLALPGGGSVTLHTPYNPAQRVARPETGHSKLETGYNGGVGGSGGTGKGQSSAPGKVRLWLATLHLPLPIGDYLARHGFPIRYRYVKEQWPVTYYQTVYATEVGSAEMPSAGRPFTAEIITQLVARGVQVVPLILHTGVASLEDHEPPYEEYYRVPASTARAVNAARAAGKRIIAVGTTVVRALETVTDETGESYPGSGWTDVVVTPQRGVRAVDGLLTGFHEPQASHLAMLEALTGFEHLCLAYHEALEQRYLWHEFGDLHLILP
ncbi:MAG TPA: S-adenosylmethionine:tRNA ribosyltransferase-isomerase [Anaerolineae bacterium]